MTSFARVLLAPFLMALWVSPAALAAESFVVRDIRVDGLQRISAGTVFNYLPVKAGETLDDARSAEAVRALFKTGFFQDVTLLREGQVLVVNVVERPAIGEMSFSGNKTLETDKLKTSLKEVGFAEGRIFDQAILDRVQQDLRELYFAQGRYGVKVETTVTPLERNRVGVNFDITEGDIARIKQIRIVGNQSFPEDTLLDLFQLSTPTWTSWITRNDQYSKQKLSGDLEVLRSFYLDRGFINFNIDSTQVSLSQDKKDVFLTVNLSEGDRYRIGEVKLAGEFPVAADELSKLVEIRQGAEFSRKQVTETSSKIAERLGDEGYAFANINAIPEIQEKTKTVDLTFFVDPGKRVYVRRIAFKGNARTSDEVMRREMRQMESAPISTSKVKRSQRRLERLGFFDEVNVETPAIAGTTDEVDVNFSVKERPSGNLMAGMGYAQTQGLIFNLGVTQENFLGTGKRVQFTFNNSKVLQTYLFSYTNPYWTADGVSRGFDVYKRKVDAEDANISDYTADRYGGNVHFGIPLTEHDTINLGIGGEHIKIKTGAYPSNVVQDFLNEEGDAYTVIPVTLGYAHDTRNRAIFPDEGGITRVSGEVDIPGGDLSYYKLTLSQEWYHALTERFTFHVAGEVAYGDGFGGTKSLPFFEYFYAGGVRSVRGFRDNTLGPRDNYGDPTGGNFRAYASAELLMPMPFVRDSKSVRLSAFVDAGNVWITDDQVRTADEGPIRYSAGVATSWYSPLGPISLSLAWPLNKQRGDDTQVFQFSLGAMF